jgi:exopolysaccharide production protein ExoZ
MAPPYAKAPEQRGALQSIRLLRFVGCLFIILYHAEMPLYRLSGGMRVMPVSFAAFGTDLFFVITGFLTVYVTFGKTLTFKDFMFRRLARLAPLYWLFTFLMLLTLFLAPHLLHTTTFDPWHVAASFAFLPYPHPVTALQRPLLVFGWVLNYFIPLYAVYGVFLFLPMAKRVSAVCIVVILLVASHSYFPNAGRLLDFYGSPMMLEFLYGLVAGLIYVEWGGLVLLHACILLGVGLAIFAAGIFRSVSEESDRVVYWGLSGVAILMSLISIEKSAGWPGLGVLNDLGDASYSTYLTHVFTLAAVGDALGGTSLFRLIGETSSQVLLVASALAVGRLTYVYLEKPWLNVLNRVERRPARRDEQILCRSLTSSASKTEFVERVTSREHSLSTLQPEPGKDLN